MKNREIESYILKCEDVIFVGNNKSAEVLIKDIYDHYPEICMGHREGSIELLKCIKQQLLKLL